MMSDIESKWEATEAEVGTLIETLIEGASTEYTPSSFLACVEDDLVGIRDAYNLTAVELDGLGEKISDRLEVKHVMCRDQWGQPFIQFFILPKGSPDARDIPYSPRG